MKTPRSHGIPWYIRLVLFFIPGHWSFDEKTLLEIKIKRFGGKVYIVKERASW